MDRKRLSPLLLLSAVIPLVAVSFWSIYRAYEATGYSTAFASAVGTLTLVIITGWYAWSTRKLLGATQAQTKATRASFAPHIDARLHSRGPDFFAVDLVNSGHGLATDIEIEARIYTEKSGLHSMGKRYRYVCHINPSLPPGTGLGGGRGKGVQIKPNFFTEVSDKTINEVLDDPSEDAVIPDVPEEVAQHLTQYLSQSDTSPKHPTSYADINGLLDTLRESDDVFPYPVFEVWIRYEDTLGGGKSYEEQICRARLDLEKDNFQQAFTRRPRILSTRGFRRRLADHFLRRARALKPSVPKYTDLTPAYESNIGSPVVNTRQQSSQANND